MAPDVRCGGWIVEFDCRGSVSALTEEETTNVGVKGEVGNGVLVLSVVVRGAFRGSSLHTSVEFDHFWFEVHLMRLEVPASLTYPSMHL